jgi:hypothetical protein
MPRPPLLTIKVVREDKIDAEGFESCEFVAQLPNLL